MAIIKCPECGRQVSDQAQTCPSCGIEIAGKVTKCPDCGDVFFKSEGMCPNCHKPYVSGGVSATPRPEATASPVTPVRPVTEKTETNPISGQDNNGGKNTEEPKKKSHTALIVSFIIAAIICAICFYYYSDAKGNKEQDAYEQAMKSTDPAVLQNFLDTYEDAPEAHRDSIESHLTLLKKGDTDWTNALISNSKSALQEYIDQHPNSLHLGEAKHKIDSIDWAGAKSANTAEAYQTYMQQHADGEHIDEAKQNADKASATEVSSEDKQMVSSLFHEYFSGLNSRDEGTVTGTVTGILNSFLGKSNATKNDVVMFMKKIYKPDITNMVWRVNNDFHIDKKPAADDGEFTYAVTFTVDQKVEKTDANQNSLNTYKIKAKVSPEGKISELNMIKIVQ